MALNSTNNSIKRVVTRQESTTYNTVSPSTTTGFLSGDLWYKTTDGTKTGSISETWRFDGTTWIMYPGVVSSTIKAQLEPVRAQVSVSELGTLTPSEGDRYILLDGTNQGKIAAWTGSAWIYYTPTNLDQTTVTTNAFGDDLGVYQYDSTSLTWVQIQQGIDLPDPEDRPIAGNFAFTSQKEVAYIDASSPMIIGNDSIVSWNNDTLLNAGDNSASASFPRKVSWNWNNLISGGYVKGANYVPNFVDGAMNTNNAIAIDDIGKAWLIGSNVTNTGFTTTPTGTTLVSTTPTYGFSPIPFFQNRPDILIRKVFVMEQINVVNTNQYWGLLSVEGNLWVVGKNDNGILGQGNTTNPIIGWVQYPIGNIVDVKMAFYGMFVLTNSGDLYFSGLDTYGFTGTANSTKTTPFLLATNVKSFDYVDYRGYSLAVVKNDGTFWTGGLNTNGHLAKGNTTNVLGITQVAGVSDAKKVFGSKFSAGYKFILLRNDGSISMAGQNRVGEMGYTPNTAATNNTTLITPAFSAQGTIVDVYNGYNTTHIVTASGTVWNSGGVNYRGIGSASSVWADANKWQQVPLLEGVVGLRHYYDASGNDATMVLCKNHKLYTWGYLYTYNWNGNNANWAYSPVYVPIEIVENGIAISTPLSSIVGVTGSITAATAGSVSMIMDNKTGQTITFTVTATSGTTGTVNLTGTTFTASPNVTMGTLQTTSVVVNRFPQTFDVVFINNTSDNQGLVVPNTMTQNYVLTLEAN